MEINSNTNGKTTNTELNNELNDLYENNLINNRYLSYGNYNSTSSYNLNNNNNFNNNYSANSSSLCNTQINVEDNSNESLPNFIQNEKKFSFGRRKISSSPIKRPRRYSQDSGIGGSSSNNNLQIAQDPTTLIRHSTDNLRSSFSTQSSINSISENSFKAPFLLRQKSTNDEFNKNLDDIIESPLQKKNKKILDNLGGQQHMEDDEDHLLGASLSSILDSSFDTRIDYNDPFGPKIVSENIPGTPMASESYPDYSQKQIESSQTNILNEFSEKRKFEHPLQQIPHDNFRHHKENNFPDTGNLNKRLYDDSDSRRPSQQELDGLDPESLMFRDGRRKIDMVLCYEEENEGVMTEAEARRREQRKIFQESLIREGLELEIEDKENAFDEKTFFVKIHIPWRTETRYAEVMNLKFPVKRFITISVKAWDDEKSIITPQNIFKKIWRGFRFFTEYDHKLIEKEPSFYSSTSGGNPEEQFIVKDRYSSYTSAQRSTIVMQILLRAKYDESNEKVGIRRLLNDGTYLASFPLHEGRYDREHSTGAVFDRRLLYLEWARPIKWYKRQPLCLVRKYFGDKIALYFCWLGFYTNMLVLPAIVGTLCFLYGLASMNSSDNQPSKEICDADGTGNLTLCPLCDKACSYQKLSDSCLFSQMTYLFDNPSTVFFAIFMSFWATTFLELWKRKQSVVNWEWDLQDIESDEENRPEFETTVKTFRTNPVTREKEPYMPAWSRGLRFLTTGAAVLFMICVVLGAVLGTIIYRISVVAVIYSGSGEFVRTHAKILTSMTAALINLIIIMILTRIYHRLAISLTNLENPRTHTEYEDSFTFKIFFFEFMNFYSSLIYIAFFKGRFYDYPGDDVARRSEFFRLKGDICDPAGCLSELCIQLAIIMVGKQCWNNFMEYLFPKMYNWWRQRKHKQQTKDETHLHMAWEQDYHLQDPGRLALFDEYLEMILQYGFVTLFVAAFPLAPLFALLNNIAEIRLDAYKMVTQARRPLADRVEDIGAWYGILKIITYTAVVSNAFVIAYTSDFIPRMVYKYVYSESHDLTGYINHSLSEFKTADYKEDWGAPSSTWDPDVCLYRGYRNGPEHSDPYGFSPHYWHVFAARLAFVVVFEHIVFVLTGIMQFIIPDIPAEVKTQIQREQLLAKEAKYQHGLKKARDNEYEDLLQTLREQNNISRQGIAGSWARRFSRMSDSLDAHVDVQPQQPRPRRSMESTVWEVT